MNERTDTALRQEGMDVLVRTLGYIDAERFISLILREPFDYTKWRQKHLADEDIRSLSRKASEYSGSITA